MFRIQKLSAFVSVDKDNEDGVCGCLMPDGKWMPLVCADEARLKSLIPIAKQIAKISGQKIKLVEFIHRREIEEISGD